VGASWTNQAGWIGELAARKVTGLTLTFDHRVRDGGTAAGFLRFVGILDFARTE